MTVAMKKWGNSLAVRIPKDIVSSLKLQNNTPMELQIQDGKLVLEPLNSSTLEDIVAKISPENLHDEIITEESIGHEKW